MAENATVKSFTFYVEYADLISLLSEEEQSSLYLKIINYIFYGREVDNLTDSQKKIWINLKRPIDKSIAQSKNVSKRYSSDPNDNTKKDTKQSTKEDTNDNTKKGTQSKMYMSNVNSNMSNVNNLEEIGCREEKPLKKTKELDVEFEKEFEKLWEYYPNKKGKEQAKKKYLSARYQRITYKEIANGLRAYIEYCRHEKLEKRYIKHGSTWFNQQCWKDDYDISLDGKSKSDRQTEILKGVHDGTIKVN